jgi:hypothetical protein
MKIVGFESNVGAGLGVVEGDLCTENFIRID